MNDLTDYFKGAHVEHTVFLNHDGTLHTYDGPAHRHRMRCNRRKRGWFVRGRFPLEHIREPHGTIDRAG